MKTIDLLLAVLLCCFACLTRPELSTARDRELAPEQVVAAHLKSMGSPELLAGIRNRGMSGKASVEFVQGGVGTMAGSAMVVSAGRNLSIILNYGALDYPGEYLAFDGTDVEVSTISPGQRSPLGDFIFRYKGLMKEGLLGGVWSLGWPLLDIQKRKPSLRYRNAKVEGRELHGIDYNPRGGMNDIKVRLFFEPDTFRHVRTEYLLQVQGEQALQAGQTVTRGVPNTANLAGGSPGGPIAREAGILDQIANSYYLLVEKFGNFKEIEFKDTTGSQTRRLVLPQSYILEYSVEGHGSSFLAHWSIDAEQWMQNGNITDSVFKAH